MDQSLPLPVEKTFLRWPLEAVSKPHVGSKFKARTDRKSAAITKGCEHFSEDRSAEIRQGRGGFQTTSKQMGSYGGRKMVRILKLVIGVP
jgi:hypothetical protein